MSQEISALIIGYLRLDGLQKNIDLCIKNGVANIFVSIDFPKILNKKTLDTHREILKYLKFRSSNSDINLNVRVACSNMGSAVNVISSCDWFFEQSNYGVILEDDCIPNDSFFSLVRGSYIDLQNLQNVWLISGSQFVPKTNISSERILSKYPQIWGWATSKDKWKEIRKIYVDGLDKPWPAGISLSEKSFWGAGDRRARSGYLDAWDIILAAAMLKLGKMSLSANVNLVSNIGVDDVSTHTKENSNWFFYPTSQFEISNSEIALDSYSNDWLRLNYFKIRPRHVFSTKWTRFHDLLKFFRVKPKKLATRLLSASKYYMDLNDFE